MNITSHEDTRAKQPDGTHKKRAYRSPVLSVFGKVALLTQGAAGSCTSDGASCTLGGTMMASDRGTKENIISIGVHPLGVGLYLFDYRPEYRAIWGRGRQFGLMADEVEVVMPQAVRLHPDGYKMVDYGMLGIRHSVH